MPKVTTPSGVHDVEELEGLDNAEVAALKSGLGPFFGRLLAALETIVALLQHLNRKRGGTDA